MYLCILTHCQSGSPGNLSYPCIEGSVNGVRIVDFSLDVCTYLFIYLFIYCVPMTLALVLIEWKKNFGAHNIEMSARIAY